MQSARLVKMLLLLVTCCVCCLDFIQCFNFDTNFPLVYTDPSLVAQRRGDRSSYFGYSVILHNGFDDQQSWIQIGAPRANSSNVKGKEPGTVFRCNIFGPCNSLDVDTYSGIGYTTYGSYKDKKDGAWIGGTMDLDVWTGRVVVCGHRWVNNLKGDYYMEGACYWSYGNETIYEKLIALVDNDKQVVFDKNSRVYLFNYAQGQAGFSAHLSNSENQSELLLGAPGVYNWDGTTLLWTDGPDSAPVASKLQVQTVRFPKKRATGFAEFSNVNIASAITTTQTASFGLFGYSVTSGHFFKKNQLLYVSGAPRSKNLLGQILVYKFANRTDQALDVQDSRQGYQYGEYFGASLVAGDINKDGLDDLVVGAPFYTSGKYNEGRVFIFLGSSKGSLETPQQNAIIEGKGVGGQFGSCIMYLGDLHWDGYADIAVGAPYENEGSGVVYIYRGNAQGLDSKPSQKIVGKELIPNIRGFGISISKPADIDSNYFDDLAIGAYGSRQAVLLRSKPVVTLQQSVISLMPRLDHNVKMFLVKACFGYFGYRAPLSINVARKIIVDDVLRRAYLPDMIPSMKMITLFRDKIDCQNITIFVKRDITNRYDPITITVSQELLEEKRQTEPIYIGQPGQTQQNDKFCKHCPVANKYRSTKEQTIELSFALGCGPDNLCITRLDFDSKFVHLSGDNRYVLGSTDYLRLETTIKNGEEKAYLTQLVVELPKSVYFSSIPANCLEQNTSSSMICNIENPLYENKQKTFAVNLDMKEVDAEKYGDILNFTLTVLTSSENLNQNVFVKSLRIAREADITVTGKSSQQSYSYGNITFGKANFTQIFQVEKFGVSPIEEVFLSIQIPTHIYGLELLNFVQLYAPEGIHANQPINCQSNIQYIAEETVSDTLLEFGSEAGESISADTATTEQPRIKRATSEEVLILNETKGEAEYPANRTFYINCSNSDVICASLKCFIGPFKFKQNVAVLRIKQIIDIAAISTLLGTKDIVILSSDSKVTIKRPPNFVQTGNRPDIVQVSSIFVGKIPESPVETWIIIVAVIVGLLLLLLVIMGLTKAGFFQRNKKKELEALKEAEEVEQFKRDSVNCQEIEADCLEDKENMEKKLSC